MFDDLKSTLHHRVLSAYERYRDVRENCQTGSNKLLDAAVDLAIALHHLPEHLPPSFKTHDLEARDDLVFISEVAKAAKHRERKHGVQKYLSKANSLIEIAFTTDYLDELGSYRHCDVRVLARCLDGRERDTDGALVDGLNLWLDFLSSRDVTAPLTLRPAVSPGTAHVHRSAARNLSIVANRQAPLKFQLRCQRFNPTTLVPDLIDLSGSDARFRVYESPGIELAITLSHPSIPEDLEATIRLTAQEAAELETATSLGLRDAMIERLALAHKEELEAQFAKLNSHLDWNQTRT